MRSTDSRYFTAGTQFLASTFDLDEKVAGVETVSFLADNTSDMTRNRSRHRALHLLCYCGY